MKKTWSLPLKSSQSNIGIKGTVILSQKSKGLPPLLWLGLTKNFWKVPSNGKPLDLPECLDHRALLW